MNHLRLSNNPRCGLLRDGLVYQYPPTLVTPPVGSPPEPHPATPDIQMLDISNEELPPDGDIYMSIGENDDDNGTDSTTEGEGDDEDSTFEDGGGDVDQSLETVFGHPPRPATITNDLDTESEDSDVEEEPQQGFISLQPNPENYRHPGPLSTQPGRQFDSMINSLLTSSKVRDPTAGDSVTIGFGGRAGEVLPEQPEHVGYAAYSHALGTDDITINEWAPFSTRMEWELARWAKTRGPSSTALSELLKINGVSLQPLPRQIL